MAISKVKLPNNTTQDIHDSRIPSSSNVGSSTLPVYFKNGVPTAISSFPEAYLSWGGKNFSASYGPIDAAMVSDLGACRTMFLKKEGIVIEYSTDAGATWIDYEATDEQKMNLFSTGNTNFVTGKAASSATASANNMLRVTMLTGAGGIYTSLNKFVIYVTTSGSSGCYCTIRCRTQKNYEDNVDTWTVRANQVPVSGWSGYNVINIVSTATYGTTKDTQYGEWQFIFGYTSFSGSYPGLSVSKIYGFGGVGWMCPSNMAKTGHIYSWDSSQKAIFPSSVKATSFVKTGGTSSQFLKADGSVDSNTYLTSRGYLGTTAIQVSSAQQNLAGIGTSSFNGVMNITGSTDYSEGIRIHKVSGLSSIWLRATNNAGYDAGMIGISGDSNGLRFRLPATSSGTTVADQLTIAYGGAITAANSITASSFIKSGGTSSQFLKADGSVDSNTYLTSSDVPTDRLTTSEINALLNL